ncbi:MAG TPA: DUF6585 family protein [Phototrophicaceae bacterium]|nr:DUF6585 family protein [Phototrophicaceae bacterium]
MMEKKSLSAHPYNSENDVGKVFLLFLIGAIYGIVSILLQRLNSSFPPHVILILMLFTLISIWAAIPASYRLWLRPGIEVYADGLHYTDRRKTQFWRWEEMDDFRSYGASSWQMGRYCLYHQGQRILILDERFLRAIELVNHVLSELQKQRGYERVLGRNETLYLGRLQIQRAGLHLNNEQIRWSEMSMIWQKTHFTEIQIDRKQQKPIKLNVHGLPDAPLLIQFISLTVENLKKSPTKVIWPANKPKPPLLEAQLIQRNIVLPLLLASLGLAVSGIILSYGVVNSWQYHLIDARWLLQGWSALIIPGISLSVFITAVRDLLENPRLVLDEISLHRYTRSGETHWRWLDISEVNVIRAYRWFIRPSIGLALKDNTGATVLVVDNRYSEMPLLSNTVREVYTNALLPIWRERFAQGERLTFSRLALDSSGLYIGDKSHAWETIGAFEVTNIGGETHLVIYNTDNKRLLATPIFTVSNLYILTFLLQEQLDSRKQAAGTGE